MKKGKIFMIIATALVCFLLTAIIFMQFKVVQETKEADINLMQEAELRQQLSSWKAKYEDAKEKNLELDETLATYKQEHFSSDKTKETMESELNKLEMALGKKTVEGSGIIITLSVKDEDELSENEEYYITADDLIYIVNYLKDAGAEAISINDERVVNSTYIVDIVYGVSMKMNGKFLRDKDFTIKAIGNTSYLENSICGKGGYAEVLDSYGMKVDVQKLNKIQIPAFTGEFEQNYINGK